MRIQHALAKPDYKVNDFQGMMDFDLRDNIRDMQIKFGMVPDGYPGVEFLQRLVGRQGLKCVTFSREKTQSKRR